MHETYLLDDYQVHMRTPIHISFHGAHVPLAARDGSCWVLNGRKWWASGAMDPRCQIAIFMGKSSPSAAQHKQQSMVLVPLDSAGVKIIRPMTVYGYDDAPHGHAEVLFEVRVLLRGSRHACLVLHCSNTTDQEQRSLGSPLICWLAVCSFHMTGHLQHTSCCH